MQHLNRGGDGRLDYEIDEQSSSNNGEMTDEHEQQLAEQMLMQEHFSQYENHLQRQGQEMNLQEAQFDEMEDEGENELS